MRWIRLVLRDEEWYDESFELRRSAKVRRAQGRMEWRRKRSSFVKVLAREEG